MKFSRALISLCGAILLSGAAITPVSAHTTLISSTPANGSQVVEWPASISLTFAEELAKIDGGKVNQVEITNAAAQSVSGEAAVNGATINVSTLPNDSAGPVLVNYRVAAADGHVVEGEFTFTYTPSTSATTSSEKPVVADQHAHNESGRNVLITGTTTVLVVGALVIGLFIYRRKY